MRGAARACGLLALTAAWGCGGGCDGAPEAPAPAWIVVRAEPLSDVDPADARLDPAIPELRRLRSAPGESAIAIDPGGAPAVLRVSAPGACPEELSLEGLAPGSAREVGLRPWLSVESPLAQVGYGAEARVEVRPGCRAALAGRIAWRLEAGAELAALEPSQNGFVVRLRTRGFEALHGGPVPWGVVPVSPRTRGESVLAGTWTGAGHEPVTVRLVIAAAARQTGLPSVPLGSQVLLGGDGWEVIQAPRGARGGLVPAGGLMTLATEVPGTWALRDGAGAELQLRVGRHDDTALDCGRAECHASATDHAATTRMTTVLARGLEGDLRPGYDPTCALGCHTVGEPGLPDGGFAHVAREGGFALPREPEAGAWDRLPISLQRLGGVGCLACHGPGAIPAPEARWAILRSDVCAVCHDAPPRYGQVAAWRGTRMARADADPRTRDGESCRGCHTTHGFLARIGVRPEQPPPDSVGPLGIACAACHAAHGAHAGVFLLRDPPPPPVLAAVGQVSPRSRACLGCHAPLGASGVPEASAAALWLGRGGVRPADGGPLPFEAAHAGVDGGCVGCHRSGPGELERGAPHRFAVDETACAPCHEDGPALPRAARLSEDLRARASARLDALARRGAVRLRAPGDPDDPFHAGGGEIVAPDTPLGRAARNALLVLEDPAVGAHAPAASALLE